MQIVLWDFVGGEVHKLLVEMNYDYCLLFQKFFFDSARRAQCMAETVDALTMLETVIEQFPNHSIILGGDLNTE